KRMGKALLVFVGLIAGLVLSTLSNWLYDLLRPSLFSPVVNEYEAQVQVETTLKNTATKPATLTVIQELMNKDEKIVSKVSGKETVPAGSVKAYTQALKISHPALWSVDNPYLYQLRTTVLSGKQVIDKNITDIGVRTLVFDANKGFFLNGKSIKIKGVCLHHDAGCLGSAVPEEVWKRRLATLKSLGCNAIRTSHNPQAPVLYKLCDEMGFLVLNEAFDEWEFPKKKWIEGWNVGTPGFEGHSEFFNEWGETDLRDMVLRDRNHPSVFMWSIGNEVDYPNDPYSHPILSQEGIAQQHAKGYLPDQPNAERLGGIAKKLAAVVRHYDLSRPVTAGLAGPVMSNETEYPGALDVVGYNYTESRYAMDHAKYPERILYGSENGHSIEAWKAVRDNEYIFGQFLWTGLDYLGESHRWPSRGFTSGLIDLAGYKKPRAYFRESLWADKPMIYIGTYNNRRNERSPSIDALPLWNYNTNDTIRVVCYTNCEKAQLALNGKKFDDLKLYNDETGVITWDVPYQPGKLEITGYKGDETVASFSIETSKRPYAIAARLIEKTIDHRKGLAHIDLQITDEDSKHVLLADDEITCQTEGPVKLLGLEAGNPSDMGDYTDNRQRVYHGRMVAYIQATGEKGLAKVTFSSPWLKGAEVEIEIE
ncbi:MAG: glycoside hydrolase family 2 TIM barrel-domain containing protein, partial [Bacteroidales bacterium]